ncbi:MAG: Na/Pi cotransporter family protein [Lentisphaeria bacterium]
MLNSYLKKVASQGIKSFFLLLLLTAFAGCSSKEEHAPALLVIRSGAKQMGLPGSDSSEDLVIEVVGPLRRRGMSNQKRRYPVADVKIKIESLSSESGALALTPEGRTDVAGSFRSKLRFGSSIGDQYFKISCPETDNVEPVFFYLICGVDVRGDNQQTLAGDELPEPIQVQIGGAENPQAGVPVFFKLISDPGKACLSASRVVTNAKGIASTRLLTKSGYIGKHEILAEIGERGHVGMYQFRAIPITAMTLSWSKLLIAVLSGLAFFIYGMTLMSDGLQLIAGNRLKNILQMFTGNRLTAVLAGLGITALLQSSSACTVMVVGFVNAELLNLTQAIGVIFGAAIGTTVTAQMVSFNLEVLALPAVCVGVITLLAAKKSNSRGIAYAVLGFGLLFFGMILMSEEMKAISDFPSFKAAFQHFDCTPNQAGSSLPIGPVLGAILVGTIMTMIVQSSSATVGLTIALAQSGLLNFYTAVPLILGDNIGTTITGLLASLNANRIAKQAAVAATIFKTLGVIIMVALFYVSWNGVPFFLHLIDLITTGDVFAAHPENIGRHLASAHTVFNIVNVLIFLPFIGFVAMLSRMLVPTRLNGKDDGNRICYLEQHLLNAPSAAFDQTISALIKMTTASVDLSRDAVNAFVSKDMTVGDKLNKREVMIDLAQHDIMEYLVKLTRRNLSEQQSAIIPVLMHCVNDVERIGDRAINIYDLINNLEATANDFSPRALLEIKEIELNLSKSGQMLVDGISSNDYGLIDKVMKHCGEISQMAARFEHNHEVRLHSKDCSVENGVIYVELLANLDRISAHLLNLAERAHAIFDHRMFFRNDEKGKGT